MTQEEVIAKVLDPKKLKRLPNSPVADIRWYPYVDTLGVDSLRVWVILKESVTLEQIQAGVFWPVRNAIHDGLLAAGVKLHPYIRYAKQSELDELGTTI
jgi:hypothetical protein